MEKIDRKGIFLYYLLVMSKIERFIDLRAWQKGHELVLYVYRLTNKFPSAERFGLTSQIRRAVVSITSNLAEGFGRRTLLEKKRFYDISIGSIYEVQNQLYIARDTSFITLEEFQTAIHLSEDTQRLTVALIRSIS